jgi:hypothetical protein
LSFFCRIVAISLESTAQKLLRKLSYTKYIAVSPVELWNNFVSILTGN